jgi:hypothetical protein
MVYYFKLFTLAIILTGVMSCKKNTATTITTTNVNTLGGSPGNCTPAVFAGTYTKGVALTTTNTVTVQVNIGSVFLGGVYAAVTNTVNGVSFSGFGTLPGMQNLILTGTGTPTNSGAQTFTVTLGANLSTCTFSLNFN